MREMKYGESIESYVIDMTNLNEDPEMKDLAFQTSMLEVLRKENREKISYRGEPVDDVQFIKFLEQGDKSHETFIRLEKYLARHSEGGQTNKRKGCTSSTATPSTEKQTRPRTAPSNAGNSAPNFRYSRYFNTIRDAMTGIIQAIVHQCKNDNVCLRCSKEGHKVTNWACHKPVILAVRSEPAK